MHSSIALIMEWKGYRHMTAKHRARLSAVAVQLQHLAFQQAAGFQVNDFAALSRGHVSDQHAAAHIPGDADDGMRRLGAGIVHEE